MADNTILISKYVQSILENNEEVRAIVGTDEHKIFPLLQPETINFPYITHSRNSLTVTYTKDIEFGPIGWTNTIQYSVKCVSNDYIQCIELANAVRHAMETYRWRTDDIYIHPIQLYNVSEYMYAEDVYVNELMFTIKAE